MSDRERLGSAQDALSKVQAQVAALEELSEQLSLSVHMLEGELEALSQEVKLDAGEASAPTPAAPVLVSPPRSSDADGARLVALNMALEGTPREVVRSYVEEHFDIPDAEGLLDEVYAAVNP